MEDLMEDMMSMGRDMNRAAGLFDPETEDPLAVGKPTVRLRLRVFLV
jgi:hypothetical protein